MQPKQALLLTQTGLVHLENIQPGQEVWNGTQWVKVVDKKSRGTAPVHLFESSINRLYTTMDSDCISYQGIKKAAKAHYLDKCVGPRLVGPYTLSPQDVMDGLVMGDGSYRKNWGGIVALELRANDYPIISSEISHLLLRELCGTSAYTFTVTSTINDKDLLTPPKREIPDRFFYGNVVTKIGFLRGLFSAIGKAYRNKVMLSSPSHSLILQVRTMLNSLGIMAFYTSQKPVGGRTKHLLTIYSYRDIFMAHIGFLQPVQKIRMFEVMPNSRGHEAFGITKRTELGEQEVFDLILDHPTPLYWTDGTFGL